MDERSPAEPSVHVIAAAASPSFSEVRWSDQGLLAHDQLLRPDVSTFDQVDITPDPIVVSYYDLDESFVGVSGDALLSYVSGVAWTEGGPENGSSYLGWIARGADGTRRGTP